jgi:methenyltetrahydrofolate cyclohydrolase
MAEKAEKTRPQDVTLAAFLESAAAAKPVPGGGGIAALSGALAASMLEMALNFTVGREKFAAVDAQAREVLARVSARRKRLLDLVEADGRAYDAVSAAMKMPKDTDAEKRARRDVMNAALRNALEPPLETARLIGEVAADAGAVGRICNPNLVGDAGVAAAMLPAAARAAALNVWANISAFDAAEAARISAEVTAIVAGVEKACGESYREIECRLRPNQEPDLTSA